MTAPIFIGDEISAAGYRLAGAEVVTPLLEARPITEALERARGAEFVLITQEYAAKLPHATLEAALTAVSPPLVVVPDARQRAPLPDLGARLRAQLGVEE